MLQSFLNTRLFVSYFEIRGNAGMGQIYEQIDQRLQTFIERQAVFFVATAPLVGDGHVNLSGPKRSVGVDELIVRR